MLASVVSTSILQSGENITKSSKFGIFSYQALQKFIYLANRTVFAKINACTEETALN
jgi:hypothetical protein